MAAGVVLVGPGFAGLVGAGFHVAMGIVGVALGTSVGVIHLLHIVGGESDSVAVEWIGAGMLLRSIGVVGGMPLAVGDGGIFPAGGVIVEGDDAALPVGGGAQVVLAVVIHRHAVAQKVRAGSGQPPIVNIVHNATAVGVYFHIAVTAKVERRRIVQGVSLGDHPAQGIVDVGSHCVPLGRRYGGQAVRVVVAVVRGVTLGVTECRQLVIGVFECDSAASLIAHRRQQVVGVGEHQGLAQGVVADKLEFAIVVVGIGQRIAVGIHPDATAAFDIVNHAGSPLLHIGVITLLDKHIADTRRRVVVAVGQTDVFQTGGAQVHSDGIVQELIHGPLGCQIGGHPALDVLFVRHQVEDHLGVDDEARGVGGLALPQPGSMVTVAGQEKIVVVRPAIAQRSQSVVTVAVVGTGEVQTQQAIRPGYQISSVHMESPCYHVHRVITLQGLCLFLLVREQAQFFECTEQAVEENIYDPGDPAAGIGAAYPHPHAAALVADVPTAVPLVQVDAAILRQYKRVTVVDIVLDERQIGGPVILQLVFHPIPVVGVRQEGHVPRLIVELEDLDAGERLPVAALHLFQHAMLQSAAHHRVGSVGGGGRRAARRRERRDAQGQVNKVPLFLAHPPHQVMLDKDPLSELAQQVSKQMVFVVIGQPHQPQALASHRLGGLCQTVVDVLVEQAAAAGHEVGGGSAKVVDDDIVGAAYQLHVPRLVGIGPAAGRVGVIHGEGQVVPPSKVGGIAGRDGRAVHA